MVTAGEGKAQVALGCTLGEGGGGLGAGGCWHAYQPGGPTTMPKRMREVSRRCDAGACSGGVSAFP